MSFVAHMINTAAAGFSGSESIPVYFSGGISAKQEVLFPIIERYLTQGNCVLRCLDEEPVEGALRRAREIYEEKLKKLK